MTYTYKSIRLHRDTKIFLRDYSMLFPFYFDFHIASEVRTSAIDTRILPSEIVADINRDKSEEVWSKRTYLELFTSNPVQLWYTRVNTDIPEAYSGYGNVISWTDDTGFHCSCETTLMSLSTMIYIFFGRCGFIKLCGFSCIKRCIDIEYLVGQNEKGKKRARERERLVF